MFPDGMMDSFDRQFVRLRDNYLTALNTHDVDAVHDYRVAVKRLKALFNLAEGINPDFHAQKQFRRFRLVFKSAAELRDLHIQIDIAGEFSTLPGFPGGEYLAFLRKRAGKAAAEMVEIGVNFDLERLEKKRGKIARALENSEAEAAGRIMRARFDSLRDELTAEIDGREPEDRKMHAVRKLAKEFHYLGEIIRDCFPERMADGEILFAKLKRVHQALGKWHDYEVSRDWLKRFGNTKKFNPESGGVEAERYIDEKKRTHREDFSRAWAELRVVITDQPVKEDMTSGE